MRLKDLEKEAILFGNDHGLGTFLPMVGPQQLYGIEVNPYAHVEMNLAASERGTDISGHHPAMDADSRIPRP